MRLRDLVLFNVILQDSASIHRANLVREGLDKLGLNNIKEKDVQAMDSVEHIDELQKVGVAIADKKVQASHFEGFLE